MNFMALIQNINCVLRLCTPTEIIFDDLAELDDKQNKAHQGIRITVKKCPECGRLVTRLWDRRRLEEYRKLQHL